jgi:hypothetical protein
MRRGELVEIIEELVEIVEHLLNRSPDQRRVIVQVVITDTEKVLLHAQEENTAGEPINRDTATAVWTSDRQDVVTVEADPADAFSAWATRVGGVVGDTTVTVTLTEPDTTDAQGNTVPGQVIVGTQVVTVNVDQTIAKVEITADTPVPA